MAKTRYMSLQDLIHHCCYLFVDPILWTSHHLEQVGCQFETVDTAQVDIHKDDKQPSNPQSAGHAEIFATNWISTCRDNAMYSLLLGKRRAFAKQEEDPDFYFARKSLHHTCIYTFRQHGKLKYHIRNRSPPWIGYLDYGCVVRSRSTLYNYSPDPSGRPNEIGRRLQEKRQALITPNDWTKDPYFLCLLLTLAQFQKRKLPSPRPKTYISRLFVTRYKDKEYVHLYDAEISAELLRALNDPKAATSYVPFPTIKYRKLSFKPYDTFAERLSTALVAPIEDPIETGRKRHCEDEMESVSKRSCPDVVPQSDDLVWIKPPTT
ncbi:hypothetical protein BDV12DRAFT_197070 [Aspergillus spectabilis]